MRNRKSKSQELAAAKAGISERSARRIEGAAALPSQSPRRYWRSRIDPFAAVWDAEVVPLLRAAPKLMGITLLRKLQDDHPEEFPDGMLRTLQRHIRQWRALEGPPKEVFFPQDHVPGHRGLSDFTRAEELRITVAGEPFAHILHHFVLAFSRWEHVEVVEGGASFAALALGLQNALWQAGGVPAEHRTDSLSAAYRLTWEQLELRLTQRQACQAIVALLEMAAHDGVEAVLAQRLDVLLAAGELPDIKQLREGFTPRKPEVPVVNVEIPSPAVYDALLASAQDEEVMA